MNAEYIIGLIAGIAAGLIIFAVAVRCCRDKGQYRSKYDERQKIAMGKAYREGFWTLLIAGVIATQLTRIDALQEYTVMIFSIAGFIGLEVYVAGCIMRDAYMGLNDKPKRWLIVLSVIAAFNWGIALFNTISGAGLTAVWANIMAGAFVVIALIAYVIRQQMIKNED